MFRKPSYIILFVVIATFLFMQASRSFSDHFLFSKTSHQAARYTEKPSQDLYPDFIIADIDDDDDDSYNKKKTSKSYNDPAFANHIYLTVPAPAAFSPVPNRHFCKPFHSLQPSRCLRI